VVELLGVDAGDGVAGLAVDGETEPVLLEQRGQIGMDPLDDHRNVARVQRKVDPPGFELGRSSRSFTRSARREPLWWMRWK
jgi:hypothetical protein